MNKEIEKILDRLERIDHKGYSCSFEFADSSSFEEVCMCFDERKKLANYIKELQQQSQKYKEVIDKVSSQIKLYGKYNGEKCTRGFSMMSADFNKLLEILKEVE